MWRLIGIVIVLLIYLVFILLNQNSTSDVNIGFYEFINVNTYIVTAGAFIAGILTAEIFTLVGKLKKRGKMKQQMKAEKLAVKHSDTAHAAQSAPPVADADIPADATPTTDAPDPSLPPTEK